ncbi:hypothetical protein EGI31_03750 [Lacihabitans soyangensis]|uniref:Uncharacterized protein n=1 Tax=Lacihabitans soyangensis TaxID=869394 RepID=A0AAE3KW00_9BACT|nr:hypothetical protein [Lacihabitans soyangensis]
MFIVVFFVFAIIDVIGEYYNYFNVVLVSRVLTFPIAYLGYLSFKKYRLEPIGSLIAASIIVSIVGLIVTHTQPYGVNYLTRVLIIIIVETQIQLFIITHYFYPKDKSIKDEFIKLTIIFSLGMIFIYFFFPLFNFGTQAIVFIRILQFSFFIAYTYNNKLLNWQIQWSVWLLLFSNIISMYFLYISPSKIYHVLVMISLFTSKFLFVNGIIESLKIKKNMQFKI